MEGEGDGRGPGDGVVVVEVDVGERDDGSMSMSPMKKEPSGRERRGLARAVCRNVSVSCSYEEVVWVK